MASRDALPVAIDKEHTATERKLLAVTVRTLQTKCSGYQLGSHGSVLEEIILDGYQRGALKT